MANKRLNAVITIGGAVAASLKSALGQTKGKLDELGGAVRKLKNEQNALGNSIQTFGRMGKNVDGLRAKYAAVTLELEKQRRAHQRLAAAQGGMAAGKDKMSGAGMALGVAAAAASVALAPVVQAAKFEKAMLGVAKQVDGARDKNGQLTAVYTDMALAIQKLGREIPIATNEIADMVTAGARMGIAKDELIEFTRTAAMMGVAFDTPAAELADSMGKIAGIFKIPMKEIAGLGDAINYLDDNAISKGSDIIKVMQGDLAGAASTMGLSAKNAAALASTFLTLGESAERADTAASGMLRQLQIAKMNPAKFQAGVEMIGMTGDQLQKGMIKDTQGTILKVLDKLAALPKEKQMEAVTRLFGKDWGGAIAKLAGGVKEYRRQLELANGEAAKGSMGREFAAQLASTAAQWELTKNTLTEISVNIGSALLPAVNSLLGGIRDIGAAVGAWARENKTLVTNVATVVGVLGAAFAATKLWAFGVGAVTFAFNALRVALMTNPIGLALTLLTTAAVLVWKNWEPIKAFFVDLWGSISTGGAMAWEVVRAAIVALNPLPLVMAAWEPVKSYFTSLWADIVGTARQSMDWIIGKINAVGAGWQKTKAFFGMGDEPEASGVSVGVKAPPVPAIPAAGGRGGNTTIGPTTVHVTTQPGQDSAAIARELAKEIDRKKKVEERSVNYDAMGNVTW